MIKLNLPSFFAESQTVEVVECYVIMELAFLNGKDKIPAKIDSLLKY